MSKSLFALILLAFFAFAVSISAGQAQAFVVGKGSKADKTATPEFEYFQLDPLVLPVISDKGIMQHVSLIVALEVPYGTSEVLLNYKPRLADAYIQALYGVLGNGYGITSSGVVDVTMLKNRLTQVTTSMLGPERIRDVLLQVVHQRLM